MVLVKPRVGLVLMRAELNGCGRAEQIRAAVEADAQEISGHLSRRFDVKGSWAVYSIETLQACQQTLRETDLDIVILAFQTWSEDSHLVSLLEAVGSRPLLVWCYLPWRRLPRPASFNDVIRGSGPVGTFAALGTLKNLNTSFQFIFGAPDDPRLERSLENAGRAALVRQALRTARFGVVPSRSEQMKSSFVDEVHLLADFGPVVEYISVNEVKQVVDSLANAQVESYVDTVRKGFTIADVPDLNLSRAARIALGMARLAVDHRLDVLAVNDVDLELRRAIGMRPALYPDLLDPLPVLFQPEADLGAATANFILNRLTKSPTMFIELWFWDEAKNHWIGGHHGLQNPAVGAPGQIWISQDYFICRPGDEDASASGAQFQFLARSGRITLFQLRSTPGGWQAIAASGVCLEGQPWVEGFPHAILRLDAPADNFLQRIASAGATQHWIMAYGSVLPEIEMFCKMMRVPLEIVTYL